MTDGAMWQQNDADVEPQGKEVDITVLKQDRVIMALMNPAYKTISAALAAEGVSMPTFHRWRTTDPEFVRRYREMRNTVWEAGKTRLSSAAMTAADTLFECMTNTRASWNVRVLAASTVLQYSDKLLDNQRIEERLERMEKDLADANGSDLSEEA